MTQEERLQLEILLLKQKLEDKNNSQGMTVGDGIAAAAIVAAAAPILLFDAIFGD